MNFIEVKKEYVESILEIAKKYGVKKLRIEDFYVELFDSKSESMALDAKSLAKALTDSMPPDSAMLFASSEDINDNPISQSRENPDMTIGS